MLITIPLLSIVRSQSRCICCDKKIKMEHQTYYESGSNCSKSEGGKVYNVYDYVSSDDVNYIDGHVYDYKCHKCTCDRNYSMSNRYNKTHQYQEDRV